MMDTDRIAELEAENKELHELNRKLSSLLDGVVNAIKGEPPKLTMWSFHDAPELARELKAENERLLSKYRHYHVACSNGTDRCAECGFDLRNHIHHFKSVSA